MFLPRLYAYEVEKSCEVNENLGAGIAIFQGMSNIALNCECISLRQLMLRKWLHQDVPYGNVFVLCIIYTGIVLGTIFAGGTLISSSEMSPGDLMSFLVASQTVQR